MFCQVGDIVAGGVIFGTVQENALINHKIMVPPNVRVRSRPLLYLQNFASISCLDLYPFLRGV